METKKYKVAIVTGGTSAEVQIALKGADVIAANLSSDKYQFYKVIIDHRLWTVEYNDMILPIDKNDFTFTYDHTKIKFDCAYVIIHGKPAENGKIQGYFDMISLPYTCSGVFASSITYNKEACKSFVRKLPIKLANSITVRKPDDIVKGGLNLKFPVFVKPNQEGSSYGISKVNTLEELEAAVIQALKYDEQVMIEEAVSGMELTCGLMMKQGEIIAFPLTEIVSKKDFFDYEAKYEGAAEEITPARIDVELTEKCQHISRMIYRKIGCKGIVRVDYILSGEDYYLLEVNSIPGLSKESIIPQQAAQYGIDLQELFDIQIMEAMAGNYQQIPS